MRRGNSLWSNIGFGQYRSRSLPSVMFSDPEWFYSAWHEKAFSGQILAEADLIYNYAKSIRPPNGKLYEYRKDGVHLVNPSEEKQGERSEFLDIERVKDKIASIQLVLLGEVPKKYVSKLDAEMFFSNPKNFTYEAKQGTGRVRGRKK